MFVESGVEVNFKPRSPRSNLSYLTEPFFRALPEQVFPRFRLTLAPATNPLIFDIGSPRQMKKSLCSYRDKGIQRILSASCSEKVL
ncbi:hypothetical protein ES288_A12G160600v1 [Gossypium darwinii]|uniref:Uncharacterized protein n=1 Tax=Gossypium darwinii TaxID=34276 RepID=A0A5D2E9N3_GOSDA|nr:hypothetical protein ES288_A12G160600v1 [Gossypium darwinii]